MLLSNRPLLTLHCVPLIADPRVGVVSHELGHHVRGEQAHLNVKHQPEGRKILTQI
jgi:hypothetical protein